MMQDVAVGLLQSVDNQLVAHIAAIDENMLAVPSVPGSAGEPAGPDTLAGGAASTAIEIVLERIAQD